MEFERRKQRDLRNIEIEKMNDECNFEIEK